MRRKNSVWTINSFIRHALAAIFTLVSLTFSINAQNIFVANDGIGTVSEFDPNGMLITNAFASGLNGPRGLAFDSGGNLYVANYNGGTVSEFNPNGMLITNAFVSGLSHPEGLAFDGSGNLYVANYGKVMKFNSSGTLITGTFVSGSGQFWDLACDNSNNLYVANYGNNTVSEFDPGGTLLKTLTGLNGPTFIAISPSPLKLVPMPWTANGFQLTVPGLLGQTYVVETSTNLNNWNPCYTNAGSFVFTDTNSPYIGQRFYRTKHQ